MRYFQSVTLLFAYEGIHNFATYLIVWWCPNPMFGSSYEVELWSGDISAGLGYVKSLNSQIIVLEDNIGLDSLKEVSSKITFKRLESEGIIVISYEGRKFLVEIPKENVL